METENETKLPKTIARDKIAQAVADAMTKVINTQDLNQTLTNHPEMLPIFEDAAEFVTSQVTGVPTKFLRAIDRDKPLPVAYIVGDV